MIPVEFIVSATVAAFTFIFIEEPFRLIGKSFVAKLSELKFRKKPVTDASNINFN